MKNNKLILHPGLTQELQNAFIRTGWLPSDVNKLTEKNTLKDHLGVIRGTHEIKPIHSIDLGVEPDFPGDWKIMDHRGSGVVRIQRFGSNLYIGEKKMVLVPVNAIRSDITTIRSHITGFDLREALKNKEVVLNDNVLKHLLKHGDLIPQAFMFKKIIFLGTTWGHKDSSSHVRYLDFDSTRGWYYGFLSLDREIPSSENYFVATIQEVT